MSDTPEHVVLHAVGGHCPRPSVIGWRRYYAASPRTAADRACQQAVERGWMRRSGGPEPGWRYHLYTVTDAGLEWASQHTGRSYELPEEASDV